MKKRFFTIMMLLTAVFVCHGSMFAQSGTYLNLGVNFPLGDFGSTADNCVLYGVGSQGGAITGINGGFKFVNNTKAEGLGFMFTIDGMYNSIQDKLRSERFVDYNTDQEGHIIEAIDGIPTTVKYPRYLNVPIMLGLNYSKSLTGSLGIFVDAGVGADARFIFPCKITAYDYTLDLKPDYTFTKRYDAKFCFAFQLGAGVSVGKAVTFGLTFFNLGKALVQGETEKLLKTTGNSPVVGDKEEFKYNQLSTKMLVLRLGIHL